MRVVYDEDQIRAIVIHNAVLYRIVKLFYNNINDEVWTLQCNVLNFWVYTVLPVFYLI